MWVESLPPLRLERGVGFPEAQRLDCRRRRIRRGVL